MPGRWLFGLFALLILLIILPSVGSTQTIGLYFDAEGVDTELNTTTQPQMVPIYLILKQDFEPIPISNWECRLTASGEGTFLPWDIAGGGLNSLGNEEFHVYLPTPLPPAEVTILASGQFVSFSMDSANGFFINSLTEPTVLEEVSPENPNAYPIFKPAMASGGSWTHVEVEGGCSNQAVAQINSAVPQQLWAYQISETEIVLDGVTGNAWASILNTGQVPLSVEMAVTQGDLLISYGTFLYSSQSFTFTVDVGEELVFRVADPGYNPGFLGEVTIAFCSEEIVLPVSRNTNPNLTQISFSPETIDFGSVEYPLETPISIPFTVTNISDEPFNFNINGNGDYTVVMDLAPLAPGATRDGEISFFPSRAGLYSRQVSFGQNAVLPCTSWAGPRFIFEENGINFGFIEYSPGVSVSQAIHLLNDTDFEYSFHTASGPIFQLEFSETPMLPHESREGLVTFYPDGRGNFEEDIYVFDTDSLFQYSTHCVGNAGPFCIVSQDTLDFGMWMPGDESVILYSVITNLSNWWVDDLPVDVSPGSPFEIYFDEGLLYPGESRNLGVRFNPTVLGTYSETLLGGDLVEPIVLIGTCSEAPSQLFLTEDEIDFGIVYLGEFESNLVHLNIEGGIPYEGDLVLEGSIFTGGTAGPRQVWFPGQPEASFGVSFDPPDTGFFTETVRFEPDNGLEVNLSGYCPGTRPVIITSTDELRFGYIPLGASLDKSFQVTNLGPGPYSCGVGTITDSTFTISPDTLILEEGETQTFTVTARGLVPGRHNARTRFESPFPNLVLRSVSFAGENPVRTGVFFDYPDFTINEIQASAGDTVTAYLVVSGGEIWALDNMFLWDGCLDITGNNELISVNYYNPEEISGSCAMTFLAPENQDGVRVAAEIRILVNCSDCVTDFVINSPDDPIEPGLANLIFGLPPYFFHARMQCPTFTGQPAVAAINSSVSWVPGDGGHESLPTATRLNNAYPNPFNPRTIIRFEVSEQSSIQLGIFDVAGRRVRVLVNESLPAGRHERLWDGHDSQGRSVASGIYFVRMESPSGVDLQKVVLMR